MSKKVVYTLLTLTLVVGLSSWYLLAQGEHRDKDEQNASGKTISVTGCLTKGDSPKEFHLTSDDGKRYELRSNSVSLADHVGHKVTVKGNAVKESEDRDEDEKNEKHEARENNAGNLQVTDLQMVSDSCK